jgi:omega-6 fatty acid desaturase (delta-12 desaturase)
VSTAEPLQNADSRHADPGWRTLLAPYSEPSHRQALAGLATSVVPYLALLAAAWAGSKVSVFLALALGVPAAGFLIRTFIVFHDCAHGSYFRAKRANGIAGAALGVVLWMPFHSWRHKHAVHHATAGDLDRRGVGDVHTLTVAEYRAESFWGRVGYRLFRNPLVMFGLGPLWVVVVGPRLFRPSANRRVRRSVLGTDLALALVVGGGCWLIGWQTFLIVQAPALLLTGSIGIWLFYVQHQFEESYWSTGQDWRYEEAALRGSSYLKLPRILQFFTGSIGFHHVHHLSVRIPNYNLERAHNASPTFEAAPTLTLWEAVRSTRWKLWDEEKQRLVTFKGARAYVPQTILDAASA